MEENNKVERSKTLIREDEDADNDDDDDDDDDKEDAATEADDKLLSASSRNTAITAGQTSSVHKEISVVNDTDADTSMTQRLFMYIYLVYRFIGILVLGIAVYLSDVRADTQARLVYYLA